MLFSLNAECVLELSRASKAETVDGHKKDLSHIAGTFLIEASASFLNGAGLGPGEDRNVSVVKAFKDGKYRIPYVSAQAWRRWLRNTLIEETGWNPSVLKVLKRNKNGNPSKIGGEFNPVDFPEDDIFGYMRTEGEISSEEQKSISANESQTQEEESSSSSGRTTQKPQTKTKTKTLSRTSPFLTSVLMSLRRDESRTKDKAYVHLQSGESLPYTTEFYKTNMQSIFCLNYKKLGRFSNLGDRVEIDESTAVQFITDKRLKVIEDKGDLGKVYEMTDAEVERKKRASELIKSISVLRGGSKQAAFGSDVSPKVIILAGLTCGNPIFNGLFADNAGDGIELKIETLKEIVEDYKDRICSPIFIGIRSGYLKNESTLRQITNNIDRKSKTSFVVTTPIDAANKMAKFVCSNSSST